MNLTNNVEQKKPEAIYTVQTYLYKVHDEIKLIYGVRSQECDYSGEDNAWDNVEGELVMFHLLF